MDYNTYSLLAADALKALTARRLGSALNSMVGMTACLGNGALVDRVNRLQADYDLMLDYMKHGYADTGRTALYERFLHQAAELWLQTTQQAELVRTDVRTAYAATRKTLQSMSVPHTLPQIAEHCDEVSPRVLFETVWTSDAWSEEDFAAAKRIYETVDETRRALLLSATMLAALHYFDVRKLALLLDALTTNSVVCRARALVGATLVALRWKDVLQFYPEVAVRLEAMTSDARLCDYLSVLQTLLLMTLEVKRIENKVQNEILPEMMNKVRELRQKQERMKRLTSIDDLAQLTANPEWERAETNFSSEFQQLMDMQRKGADVFISSFRTLKSRFPFFSVAANWFYPFTTKNQDLPDAARGCAIAKMIESNALIRQQLCDSDCYSISLMFGDTSNRLVAGMTAEVQETLGVDFNKHAASSPSADGALSDEDFNEAMHRVLRSYVQDVYRYFKLFRGRDERVDPFKCNLLLLSYPPFAKLLHAPTVLKNLGDFAFSVESYAYAAAFYEKIEAGDELTAEVLQKMGYCHQILGDYEEAAATYERANLVKNGSEWTLRQLATCYRRLGRTDEALRVYEELSALSPDDAATALRMALCHMEQEHFEAAMPQLYKAYYLAPDNANVLRAIAWCAFRLHQDEKAEGYYAKLLAVSPQADDYLNAGHVAWVTGNVAEAVHRYKDYLRLQDESFNVSELFLDDASLLRERGISEDELNIMCDALAANP